MGSSVSPYWPGVRVEDILEAPNGPGACGWEWASWISEVVPDEAVMNLIRLHHLEPLVSQKGLYGETDEQVTWTNPTAMIDASERLVALIEENKVDELINKFPTKFTDNPREEMIAELHELILVAEWAKAKGVEQFTLELSV